MLSPILGLIMAASFQCPDGSPPPCARAPVARAAAPAAVDPNRIVVLPFRVTTADSLLGEGLAELVATEFTGRNSPLSVNMGTVLRAWRAAGGGLRAPLAQERAIRLAREVGAAHYVEGSVVGLGPRLTINAAVISVGNGVSSRVAPVAGPADSLDVLIGRLTSALLAAAGSERGAADRARLTDSPVAMRHYLQGLAHWRTGLIQPAATAFEAAFREDPGFARAAFMRWLAGGWAPGGREIWTPRIWALRDRLSAADRVLLLGQLGEDYQQPRSPARVLADRQRAAEQLPESAEAEYFVGDYFFHFGSFLELADPLGHAVSHLERSAALDPQSTVLEHLVEIALITGDTALAARTWPALERASGGGGWDWGMAVAGLLGDRAMLAAQRRRAGPIEGTRLVIALPEAVVPPDVASEVLQLQERHTLAEDRSNAAFVRFAWAINNGRPTVARAAQDRISGRMGPVRDLFIASAALFSDGDSAAGAAALERLRSLPDTGGVVARHCLLGWYDLAVARRRAEGMERAARSGGRCRAILDAMMAVRDEASDARSKLLLADSLSRNSPAFDQPGFDRLVLALAWEAHGDAARALGQARITVHGGLGGSEHLEARRLREEGRLALLAGDREGARKAWRRYLMMRADPEPALIPQRDSVRSALAVLER